MNNAHWKVMLSDIEFNQEEAIAVSGILRSKWLSMGEKTAEFENYFKRMHQVKYAVAVTNCTSALHLANLALGIGRGDEVICPALTFVATANSILYAGALPVFADISSTNDLTISPEDIERKISPRTKAIMLMHYGGYPCNMQKIRRIASRHNLFIIEDCAHAPLVKYGQKYLGAYGEIGCFSFFANKNITTAEGGMLTTASKDLARKLISMRSHGMTSLTLDRYKGHASSYDVVDLGFNYRIDEIRSALGVAQLKKLAGFNQRRRQLVSYYRSRLDHITGIELPFQGFNLRESSCHIFPILVKNSIERDRLRGFLKHTGIQTSLHYEPVHLFSYYRKRFPGVRLKTTEDVCRRVITLPLFASLKRTQIDYIAKKIKQYFLEVR